MGIRMHGLARLAVLAVIGATATAACGGGATNDLLAKVKAADKIVMSTDPEYPPQSSLADDGSYEGFDIDVGTEIAKRLGVEIAFETPSWEAITAGSWSGRWDFSVGSMAITTAREKVIAFTNPYYYTPAQMAVLPDSGITSLDELAGKVICVGEGTTYLQWLDGTLDFGTATPETQPPAGATATTLKSDRNCAESWQAGRRDFDGWLSSVSTVQGAIDAGLPVMKLGDPVFNEPLAVAFDKGGPSPTTMVAEVDKVLDAMRSDGTLKGFSEKWFGEDLTTKVGG